MFFLKGSKVYSHPDKRIEKSLHHSLKDGCFHAMMMGMGETYLSAFAIFLGVQSLAIGWLASLPLLIGSLAQLFSINLINRLLYRKKIVVIGASLQACMWPLFFLLPYFIREKASIFLILLGCFYYGLAHLIAPPWNSWMGDLVPGEKRGRYFGYRNQLRSIYELTSFILAGLILHRINVNYQIFGFAIIFFIAFVSRLASSWHIHQMEETSPVIVSPNDYFTFWDFIRRVKFSNFAKYTFFVAFLLLATNIASPFFSLYMLRDLQFSYFEFSIAISMSFFGQLITFQSWGKIADRFGNRRIIELTSFLVCFLPLLWVLTTNIYLIFFFQFLGGAFWSGFNLCAVNFIFDAVTPAKRSRCIAYYNIIAHAGIFIGATLGGFIIPKLPSHLHFLGLDIHFLSSLPLLFLISGILRFVPALLGIPFIKEVRKIEPASSWKVAKNLVGLYFDR